MLGGTRTACFLARDDHPSHRYLAAFLGVYWVVAIYKKRSVYGPKNYRGVHLTAQLAKVIERLLQPVFVPILMSEGSIGKNQFAYCRGRGARDAIAFLVLSWLTAFREKPRVALYMSDVSAAFDRVFTQRLLDKLAARGVPAAITRRFGSWLATRRADGHIQPYGSRLLPTPQRLCGATAPQAREALSHESAIDAHPDASAQLGHVADV